MNPRENPFPGLRPFEQSEAHLFFGRESQVDALCQRLSEHRFMAVLGPSGCGKSSLIRAGLLPALHRASVSGVERWRVADMKPGKHPFRHLTQALVEAGLLGHYRDEKMGQRVCLHPTGQQVAIGYSDGTVRLLQLSLLPRIQTKADWSSPQMAGEQILFGLKGAVRAVTFHPDGTELWAADDHGNVGRFLLAGKPQWQILGVVEHPICAWVWLSGSRALVALSNAGPVYQANADGLVLLDSQEAGLASWSAHSDAVAVGDYAGILRVFQLPSFENQAQLILQKAKDESVSALALSAERLAIGCEDGRVEVYRDRGATLESEQHLASSLGLAFSPDGLSLALVGVQGLSFFREGHWSAPTGQGFDYVLSCPSGLILRPIEGGLRHRSLDGEDRTLLFPAQGRLPQLIVSGNWLMGCSRDGGLTLWDTSDHQLEALLMAGEETRQTHLLEPHLRAKLDPLTSMVAPQLEPGEALLLLVDQFEELHNLEQVPADEAAAFVRAFLAPLFNPESSSQRIFLMLTMRSDFLGDCHRYRRLPEELSAHQYLVPRLTRAQLQRAIEMPLKLSGVDFEPGLIPALLSDHTTAVEPGIYEAHETLDQLPVLQHTLARLWDQVGTSQRWTVAHYQSDSVGGSRALQTHLNRVCRVFDEAALARLFCCLSDNSHGRPVRRRCTLQQLEAVAGPSTRTMVERLRQSDCNFLTPRATYPLNNDTLVDIPHEAILRQWSRYSTWLEQEDEHREKLLRLAANRESSQEGLFVMRDPEVAYYEKWVKKFSPTAAWAQRYLEPRMKAQWQEAFQGSLDYLKTSRKAERGRKVRWYGSFLLVLFGFAMLSGFLYWQNGQVRRNAEQARQAHIDGLTPLAEALATTNPRRGLLLAALAMEMEAARLGKNTTIGESLNTFRAVRAYYKNYKTLLEDGFGAWRITETELKPAGDGLTAISCDGLFAAAVQGKEVRLWSMQGKPPLLSSFSVAEGVEELAVSAEGYVATRAGSLISIHDRNGHFQFSPQAVGVVREMSWSNDRLITCGENQFQVFPPHASKGPPVKGDFLASSCLGQVVYRREGKTFLYGTPGPILLGSSPMSHLRFGPNGKWLIGLEYDSQDLAGTPLYLHLWDLSSKKNLHYRSEKLSILGLQTLGLTGSHWLAIDQQGLLYSGSLRSMTQNYSVIQADDLLKTSPEVNSVVGSSVNARVAVSANNGSLQVFELGSPGSVNFRYRKKYLVDSVDKINLNLRDVLPVSQMGWSPEGRRLTASLGDGSVHTWTFGVPTAARSPMYPLPLPTDNYEPVAPLFGPDGKKFAYELDGKLRISACDGTSEHPVTDKLEPKLWSPDGKWIAGLKVGPEDQSRMSIWQIDGLLATPIAELSPLKAGLQWRRWAFTSDHNLVQLDGKELTIWSGQKAPQVERMQEGYGLQRLSPDGRWLSSWSQKELRLYRVDTGLPLAYREKLEDLPDPLEFTPNGKGLVAISGGQLRAWKLANSNWGPVANLDIQATSLNTLAVDLEFRQLLVSDTSRSKLYTPEDPGRITILGGTDNYGSASLTAQLVQLASLVYFKQNVKEPPIDFGLTLYEGRKALSNDARWASTDSVSARGIPAPARIWSLDPKRLIPGAVEVAGRRLTREEVETYHLEGLQQQLRETHRTSSILPNDER